jgi:opacity protein-like surface antigen
MTLRRSLVAIGCSVVCAASVAADAPDEDALSLADKAEPAKRSTSEWRAFGEVAWDRTSLRDGGESIDVGRLSLDLRYDGALGRGVRGVLSNRLDATRGDREPRQHNVNTLREAYLSAQLQPQTIVDIGRVNVRNGVAYGYNPTDFFKAGALRSIVSLDPAVLRENRQGTFAIQGQQLWDAGSMSAAWSPDLGKSRPSDAALSLDTGATNARQRWLVTATHRLGASFAPQLLAYGGQGLATQAGLNISSSVSDSTVLFFEGAAGRSTGLTVRALDTSGPRRSQRQAAAGLTHTTALNLSLTVEAEYDSAAPSREEWRTFTAASPLNALLLLGYAEQQQALPTRHALFIHAKWQDALTPGLDLLGFIRHDGETSSQVGWLETRYRWRRDVEFALQWLRFSGSRSSIYGSMPQSTNLTLAARMYL